MKGRANKRWRSRRIGAGTVVVATFPGSANYASASAQATWPDDQYAQWHDAETLLDMCGLLRDNGGT